MLNTIKNSLSNLASYKTAIFIAFILFIFIMVSLYVYKNYKQQQKNNTLPVSEQDNEQNNSSDINNTVDLYLFYTEWCPHCKKAKPEWETLKNKYSTNMTINSYKINFVEVDCDANTELANKFKVEGYPTIKMVKGNQIIEFDAKPDIKNLEEFLSTVLST